MKRLSLLLPPSALKTVFYSLFFSHINYASVVWGHFSASKLKPIVSLYQRTISLISNNIRPINSFSPISITNLYLKHISIIYYKYKNNSLPTNISQFISSNLSLVPHAHYTRSRNIPRGPLIRTEIGRQSLIYNLLKHFEFVSQIIKCNSINTLKRKFKNVSYA